jgi:hypothetical protein
MRFYVEISGGRRVYFDTIFEQLRWAKALRVRGLTRVRCGAEETRSPTVHFS